MSGETTVNAEERAAIPLTLEQRRLVWENIGLVAVHLRRNVEGLGEPRRDREWEDLFQEGCLGLIQAVVTYRPDRGIAFAAFALPRIHNAVTRALQRKFSTVYIPPTQARDRDPIEASTKPCPAPRRPAVHSLTTDLERRLADKRRHHPDTSTGETIGERLRGKYERAARTAGDVVAKKTSTRGDRDKLVRVLMDERLLVPNEGSRVALRSIARRTGSSYARVAQCERQLKTVIGDILESDPEFRELQRRARKCSHGTELPIDDELEQNLASVCTVEFVHRFRRATRTERGRMLAVLLEVSPGDIDNVLCGHVVRLPMQARETLLHETT